MLGSQDRCTGASLDQRGGAPPDLALMEWEEKECVRRSVSEATHTKQ